MAIQTSPPCLRRAAWLSVVVHLVAGLAMAVVLRNGLETNRDMLDRLRFLVDNKLLWQAAWCTWNLAALAMLYFVVCFRRAHQRRTSNDHLLDYALVICAAAVPLDLASEGIEMAVLPELARSALSRSYDVAPHELEPFNVWHRAAVILTGFLANGLYTLSAVLLMWTTRRVYPMWVTVAGCLVGLGGFGLSAAVLFESLHGMVIANVVLVPAILAWQIGIAVTRLRSSES